MNWIVILCQLVSRFAEPDIVSDILIIVSVFWLMCLTCIRELNKDLSFALYGSSYGRIILKLSLFDLIHGVKFFLALCFITDLQWRLS